MHHLFRAEKWSKPTSSGYVRAMIVKTSSEDVLPVVPDLNAGAYIPIIANLYDATQQLRIIR
ncbi:MAG: hypothetical protein CMM07_02765 [Rhodopirellula sp.]|nr:hypothetical protein [Rhodopirellula sp.]